MKPLFDRVVIKPDEAESKTAGGLIIPDVAKERPQKGVVVACGPGKPDVPNSMPLNVGDVVLYGKYAGQELPPDLFEGNTYLIMRAEDVLMVP